MNKDKLKPYLVDYLDAQGQKIDGQLIFARDSTAASMAVLNILPEARTVVSVQRSICQLPKFTHGDIRLMVVRLV